MSLRMFRTPECIRLRNHVRFPTGANVPEAALVLPSTLAIELSQTIESIELDVKRE